MSNPSEAPEADARSEELRTAFYSAIVSRWGESRSEFDRSIFTTTWASLAGLCAGALTQQTIGFGQTVFGFAAAVAFFAALYFSFRIHRADADYLMRIAREQAGHRDSDSSLDDLEDRLDTLDGCLICMFSLGLFFTACAVCATLGPRIEIR